MQVSLLCTPDIKSFMMTHFDLVEGTQTVVPGWYQVWEHTVQDADEPTESEAEVNNHCKH